MVTKQYHEALKRQADRQTREITPINKVVAEAIEKTADKALKATRDSKSIKDFQVISAPTGSAKTQSAIAYAISQYKADPLYTCAFIVEEVKHANDVYNELRFEIPRADVGVWTSYHDESSYEKGLDNKGVHTDYDKYNFIPDTISRDAIKEKKIAIFTHTKWLNEMKADTDFGVRYFLGKPRDNIFVDERPNIIGVIELTPTDMTWMQELITQVNPNSKYVKLVGDIAKQMIDVYSAQTQGQLMEANLKSTIGDCGDILELCNNNFFDDIRNLPKRSKDGDTKSDFLECVDFLLCCQQGYVFYSIEEPPKFVAYLPIFKAESNIIILDGTADLSTSYRLMGGSLVGNMPQIDYSNLTIKQIEAPKKYRGNLKRIVGSDTSAQEYYEFIKTVVKANVTEGDNVLIICHKKLVYDRTRLGLLSATVEPDTEMFKGCKTLFLTWGQGVGSNKYKDATKVFTFGEFHKPKRVTVAHALGYQNIKAKDVNFSQLNGRLVNEHKELQESDLLRWQKQLMARGNVRNITSDGKCGKMSFYTTMSWNRLIDNVDSLFPNADIPTRDVKHSSKETGNNKRYKLVEFLSSTDRDKISFKELSELIDIPTRRITTNINADSVKPTFDAYKWKTVSSKDLGEKGKGLWLIKE